MLISILFSVLGWLAGLVFNKTIFKNKLASNGAVWGICIASTLLMLAPIKVIVMMAHLVDAMTGVAGSAWALSLFATLKLASKEKHTETQPQSILENKNTPTTMSVPVTSHTSITPNQQSTREEAPITPSFYSATMDDDKLWAQAMQEVESPERKVGLWARCFAQADGDENKAKAKYVKERVAQEQQAAEQAKTQKHLADQLAEERRLTELQAKQAAEEAAKPKGNCPHCSALTLLDASTCRQCGANFEGAASWKPLISMYSMGSSS